MPNPYILLALVIGWGASVAGAGWWGIGIGEDRIIATQAKVNKAIDETRAAAQQGAADAIAKIEIKNITVNRKLETLVRENRVFADCRSGPSSVHLYNSSIPGYSEPPGGKQLPSTPAPAK